MTSFCTIHQVEMTRYEKDGREWFSHKAGDTWCKGEGLGKAVSNGRTEDKPVYQQVSAPQPKTNWGDIKDLESKKMLVMSAMKAASEMTKAMMDTGMFDVTSDVDGEVIKRMRRYIAEMEKQISPIPEQTREAVDPGF